MHISVRAGDRLYVNGAVLRFDRKVTIELMNDVTFLLESHVLLAKNADTPLKQLYFVVQTLLIDPASGDAVQPLLRDMLVSLSMTFTSQQVLQGLLDAEAQIAAGRSFEALKTIRALYPIEASILDNTSAAIEAAA